MLIYFLLDTSTTLILWLIKNLGYATYSSIRYLIYGTEDIEEKKTLEMLIEQKNDIEEIKEYIEFLKKK
jgi:hypothetical protein